MASTFLPPVEGGNNPCGNCPPITERLPLDAVIAVGLGEAALYCDGELRWDESHKDWADCRTVYDAEQEARRDASRDWRIVLNGPLHGETYQRQGPNSWVLVERNQGFA